MRRIEVRTARTYGVPEKLSYPTSSHDEGRQDHFAAVLPDQIVYIPEITLDNAPKKA
jgi:hypothetical protein